MASTPSKPPRLGAYLLEKQLISLHALDAALAEQQHTNEPLGKILAHQGALANGVLYLVLAEQCQQEWVDLTQQLPDENVLKWEALDAYLERRYLPLAHGADHLTVACTQDSASLRAHLSESYRVEPANIRLKMTSPFDILWAVERVFGASIGNDACYRLLTKQPLRSARHSVVGLSSKLVMGAVFLAALLCWPSALLLSLILLLNGFYVLTLGLKLLLFGAKGFYVRQQKRVATTAPALKGDGENWPVYSILVPMYDEACMVPHVLAAIRALDYPKSRLDVKLVVEGDDAATIAAIKAAQPEACFEMIRVPPSQPRTKPKACNYAMRFVRGEYVTIFDAEDIPEPAQLKKAVRCFRAAAARGEALGCVQARLCYYNDETNLLTRLFALEYASLFAFLHRGLAYFGIPIPLGGTSNHLPVALLKEAGNWDPYNVTEDADLGVRLATEGYATQPLDSFTREEAPAQVSIWLKQRSRWVKGYIQTWLVYLRAPVSLCRHIGFWRWLGLQTFLGGASLIYMAAPFLWLLSIGYFLGLTDGWLAVPEGVLQLSFTVLMVSVVWQWAMALWVAASMGKWRAKGYLLAVLAFPFYWCLHVAASFLALWELVVAPYRWHKTPHKGSF